MQFISQKDLRTTKRDAFWLFMIGCFSMTQLKLGAKIGISEAGCLFAMPFIIMRDYVGYKKDGVMLYFNLLLLWILGAIFSDWYNHSIFEQFMRGFSVPLLVFSCSVCIYHFLRRYPDNLKWLLFGIAVSSVISIFVFQRGRGGDLAADGDLAGAVEAVVGYKLFLSNTIKTWFLLPIQTMYMKLSVLYIVPAMIAVAIVNALSGGRSAFAVSILAFCFVMIGGKRVESIRRIKRFFPMLIMLLLCLMFIVKYVYSYAAQHGYLNDAETGKYEKQTAVGTDIKSLLLAGRSEFFVGLFAALDKPFVGQGSQPLDFYGYGEDFLRKYGTEEEVKRFLRAKAQGMFPRISSHSHIICYWMWHGVTALAFWLYIFYLVIVTIYKRLTLIPEWFGFLAIAFSDFLWDYFFSPFGMRVSECAMFCAMLVLIRVERLRRGI